MTVYILEAHIPYDRPDCLYTGGEDGLRAFIAKHLGEKVVYRSASGKEHKSKTVCGYPLADLSVTIRGPDVETFLP